MTMPPKCRMINPFCLALLVSSSLVGCAQRLDPSPIADIPSRAFPVKEGSGRLFFQTMDSGTIYVFDADKASLLLSAPASAGDRFVLDPARGQATLEGRPVFEKPIPKRHTFRVYFEPHAVPATQP